MLCEGVVRMQCSMWDVRMSEYSKKVYWVCHDCGCGMIVMCYKNILGILWMHEYCLAV